MTLVGRSQKAREAGIVPCILDTETGDPLKENDSPVLLDSDETAERLAALCPDAQLVWYNDSFSEPHRVCIWASDDAALAAYQTENGLGDLPPTLTHAVGDQVLRHFYTPTRYIAGFNHGTGVDCWGLFAWTPVPGEEYDGHTVGVVDDSQIAEMPSDWWAVLRQDSPNDPSEPEGDATDGNDDGDTTWQDAEAAVYEAEPEFSMEGEVGEDMEVAAGQSDRDASAEADAGEDVEHTPPATRETAPPPTGLVDPGPSSGGFSSDGEEESSRLVLRGRVAAIAGLAEAAAAASDQRLAAEVLATRPRDSEFLASLINGLARRGDMEFAGLVHRLAKDTMRLTPGKDAFVLQRNHLWRTIPAQLVVGEAVRLLTSAVEICFPAFISDAEERQAFRKALKRYFTASGVHAVAALLRTFSSIHSDVTHFDRCPGLISFANGLFDPVTGVLRPRRPSDLLMRMANANYNSESTCPTFDDFMLDSLGGDEEAVRFVLMFIAYAALGNPRLKKMLVLYGEGDSGKSLLFAVISRVLGPIVEFAHRRVLFRLSQGSATDPHSVRLIGSRLVVVSESREGEVLDDTLVKSMASGLDPLVLRGLYRDPVRFIPSWTCFLVTNFLPTIPTSDTALLNRLDFVRFTKSTRPRDPQLFEKLVAEQDGIATKIANAACDFLREGLVLPPSLQALREEVLASSESPIAVFFAETFEVSAISKVRASEVRERALSWFPSRGFALPSEKALGDYVRAAFDESQVRAVKSSGVMVYRGLKVREAGEELPAA